ncbi:MAG: DUF2220 family protein [Gammaproteobacteria bacterium]|nr:DUF2220 family protein [Gammaproteobacteria bacterium]
MGNSCNIRVNARLALLEILAEGKLKRRHAQAEAYETLAELSWTKATGRRGEIGLIEERRSEVVTLIARVWPDWRETLADLIASGLPPTPEGYRRLLDRERVKGLPNLPSRINRRTATALIGPDSKALLTGDRRVALGDVDLTHDGSIRLRPPDGLTVCTPAGVVNLSRVAEVLGEASIPERAFLDGLVFEGPIRAVLLVENLGAWRDLPAPPGWLLAYVPGWDTATAEHLLKRLTAIPAIHFGDLDPNGVRIMLHLRQRAPNLKWFLPGFWFENMEEYGLRASWPADADIGFAPPQVRELVARGLWLEQERIVFDTRIIDALEESLVTERDLHVSSASP